MIKFFTTFILFHTLLLASFTGMIFDKETSIPIVGADISDSKSSVKSDINGWFHFRTNEKVFSIKAHGYKAAEIKKTELRRNYYLEAIKKELTTLPDTTSALELTPTTKVAPIPKSISAAKVTTNKKDPIFTTQTVIDKKSLKPIAGATISDSNSSVSSDKDGSFDFKTDDEYFHIKSYGYKALHVKKDSNITTYQLEPINVKALYLTFWGASGNSTTMERIFKIVEETEVNSIVVDIKNEYGSTLYLTSFKQANSYGAHENRTNRNISRFMNMMKERNIYTIARIVTFKDELQASNNPDYAIKNQEGEIWRNHDNMAWVDPCDTRSHEYAIRIAEEAAKVGFDEINFDYIRFPAKADLVFSKENTQENRVEAINTFLDTAKQRLQKYGVYISVDTYGNILWTKKGDNNIGQTVKSLAEHADYLAPMLYPSGFASGSFGKENPSSHPFIVIYRSIKHIENIIDPSRVRPWLQYFRDYAHTRMHYKKHEVTEQVRAAEEMKTNGWMMWSPSSKYHINYFKK